jgi:hypothetical protein
MQVQLFHFLKHKMERFMDVDLMIVLKLVLKRLLKFIKRKKDKFSHRVYSKQL